MERKRACAALYGAMSDAQRAPVTTAFQGRPQTPATDAAWCEAVERTARSYGVTAPSGSVTAPAGTAAPGTTVTFSDAESECNDLRRTDPEAGWTWSAADQMCVVGGPHQDTYYGENGSATPSPTELPGPDHTTDYINAVLAGSLGIASIVQGVINGNNTRDYNQFMAGLRSQEQQALIASRAGDRAANEQLQRIQLAIAESQRLAAEANRAAIDAGRAPLYPTPQGTPTWVYVAGTGLAATAVLVLVYVFTRPPPVQQLPDRGR